VHIGCSLCKPIDPQKKRKKWNITEVSQLVTFVSLTPRGDFSIFREFSLIGQAGIGIPGQIGDGTFIGMDKPTDLGSL
jgi:hypothetical protein